MESKRETQRPPVAPPSMAIAESMSVPSMSNRNALTAQFPLEQVDLDSAPSLRPRVRLHRSFHVDQRGGPLRRLVR
jgi:hypothetical protein